MKLSIDHMYNNELGSKVAEPLLELQVALSIMISSTAGPLRFGTMKVTFVKQSTNAGSVIITSYVPEVRSSLALPIAFEVPIF